jgi:hypothetical protein
MLGAVGWWGGMTTCSREARRRKAIHAAMAISAGSERSRQKEKERRSLAHFGWSFVCACAGR